MNGGKVIMALVSMMAISPVVAEDPSLLSVTRTYPAPVVNRLDGYDEVRVGELPGIRRRNTFFLPADPFDVLIPFGYEVTRVEVHADGPARSINQVYPPASQEPTPFTASSSTGSDAHTFAPLGSGDTAWMERVENAIFRGYRMVRFIARPVRVDPDRHLDYVHSLTLRLHLAARTNPTLFCPHEQSQRFVLERVVNPEALATYHDADAQRRVTLDYLVVGPAAWASTVDPLIQHHEAQGLRCRYEALEELRDRCRQGDDPSRIRQRVTGVYREEGLRYLLLLGGEPVLMDRRVYARPWPGADEANMPADLYFAALEPEQGGYDANGNQRFGEWDDGPGGDDVDLAAEIAIGRLPVRSIEALEQAVRKIIRHQRSLAHAGPPRVLGLSEHLGFQGDLRHADPLVKAWTELLTGSRPVDFTLLSDAEGDWNRPQLETLLAAGVDAVMHAGHGTYRSVMKINRETADSWSDHPPYFLYTQACFAGAFDRHRSFAELMIGSASGPSAILAGARESWQTKDAVDSAAQRFSMAFWEAAARSPHARLGDLLNAARHDARWDPQADGIRWTLMHMNLLGDPAQPLFARGKEMNDDL